MREVIDQVNNWLEGGERVVLATVVQTWGSSPRREGAKMAFTPDGKIAGSVSGGCVEGAVFEAGVKALKEGKSRLLQFGVADETAWEVGLACGGHIEVFVNPVDPAFFRLLNARLLAEQAFALATILDGPENLAGMALLVGTETDENRIEAGWQELLVANCQEVLVAGRSRRIECEWQGEVMQAFIEVIKPEPVLVAVGGVHIAIALTELAKTLGYQTVVIDPRRSFGSVERFPHVDRLIRAWPQEALAQVRLTDSTAIVMLTHDPKIDDPALKIALQSPVFYIGALGSNTTQEKRRQRLLDAGITQEQLTRLHGPIGLPIGGQTPEEIALAVMAEIVAVFHQAIGTPEGASTA
jgi:xanthine dehydrogenase accessory factor